MTTLIHNARLLDPRLFPAFVAAAELRNFTHAAEAAHMTQSGVSQHIAKLEEQIGRPLFKRLGKTVVLTRAGEVLLRYIQEQVANTNALFDRMQTEEESVSGLVSYGMPPSCLLSDHFATILKRRQQTPELELKIVTGSPEEILELVLRDEVDFGFVAGKHEHAAVTFTPYCEEECVLVSSDNSLPLSSEPERLFETPVVSFPGSDVYYDMWLQHTLPEGRKESRSLRKVGEINSIEAAIMMVVSGLGCGVFPRHCVERQLTYGTLHEYSTLAGPLLHSVYIARIAGYQPTRRVQCVLDWFSEMLAEQPKVTPAPAFRSFDRPATGVPAVHLVSTVEKAKTVTS
jgi:DNA-binding transcriptional LysR family regulator